MILVLKPNTSKEDIDGFVCNLKKQGFGVHLSEGIDHTLIGLIGDTSRLRPESFSANQIVANVVRVQSPYKMANRAFHPDNTTITIGANQIGVVPAVIGGNSIPVIAGPCSVESEEQLTDVAECVKASGAKLLRGGAFKPRTSPYSFQGLGGEGI